MWIIISYAAAILTTLSFLPQALKVIKTRNTKDISLCMYFLFTVGVVLWALYGFFNQEYAVGIANALTFVFAAIILVYKIINTIRKNDN